MDKINIRVAHVDDAQNLLNIYAYYVENSALTFEYEIPSLDEFKNRIQSTLKMYPYLVAEFENEVVGYAYAGQFHPRAAYAWNAELYKKKKKGYQRLGIGKKLYQLLEDVLRAQGVVKTIALITFPSDKYSDFNSMQFHEKMGYSHAGRLESCGYKFGRWYSTLYMDKFINQPISEIQSVKNFDEVRSEFGL